MKSALCPLHKTAKKSPDQIAVIFGQQKLSYRQLNEFVTQAQGLLTQKGVKPQTHVAILGAPSVEYIVSLFALWRIGAVACLLSTRTPREELTNQLSNLSCTHVICTPQAVDTQIPLINFLEILQNTPNKTPGPQRPVVAVQDPATIILTSGSTGDPKAVVLSLDNHLFNALGSNKNIRLRANDRWLLSLPLYHVSGLSIIFRTILAATAMVIPNPDEDIVSVLKREKITHISLVTTQLIRLLTGPKNIPVLRRLKAILLGGSSIPQNLLTAARKQKLPVYTTYGLTEMASQVATTTQPCFKGKNFPAATVLAHRQLKINPRDEILVKGKTLFLGYYQHRWIIKPFQRDGWFVTGDLGQLDKKGNLLVTGRRDNMFISGGENIQPEEIENVILSLTGVDEALVIPHPDKEFGELPVAFIKFQSSAALNVPTIRKFLASRLPSFKIPKRFFLWPTDIQSIQPKTNRQEFRQLILTGQISLRQLM